LLILTALTYSCTCNIIN